MPYDPMQAAYAKADIARQTATGISSQLMDFAEKIPEIIKRKNIDKEIRDLYGQSLHNFATELIKIDPSLENNIMKGIIEGRKIIKKPMQGLSSEQNIKSLVSSAEKADKYLDKKATEQEATGFVGRMQEPIEQRQIQPAEGPPTPGGEFPMEEQVTRVPISSEKYRSELSQLSPEARKQIPETLGKQVETTEQIFQQPLKTFEEDREQSKKDRESNIKTMTGVSKEAGFHTAILESQNAVESLKTKKKTLGELSKTVMKANNLDPRQIESGKQTDLQLQIERVASELGIPQQFADDTEFLGRMNAEIDRLINKEEDQQKAWDTALKDWQKRMKEEAARKRAPRPAAETPGWKLGKELQQAVDRMAKIQFPNLYKVIEGEYGVEVMKNASGIADAARAITRDPKKRVALAYAYPDETGKIAVAGNVPKPSDEEIQAVLQEMEDLQNQAYGYIPGYGEQPASPTAQRGSGF